MLAERLRASIASEPVRDSTVSVDVTASLGVSSASDTKSADQLLKATDEALYAAKAQGRNRVITKPPSPAIPAGARR
jgi:diguanylate cyclase (GGDEF)-like protein